MNRIRSSETTAIPGPAECFLSGDSVAITMPPTPSSTAVVPRLLTSNYIAKKWFQKKDPSFWSPHKLLAGKDSFFPPSSIFNVKRSLASRFFMYEEHTDTKLHDATKATEVIQLTPTQLADALYNGPNDSGGGHHHHHHHHYCTFPIRQTAPGLLSRLEEYEQLHEDKSSRYLDPRGPSLWMGTSGSSTQAHYDVADNIICQMFGTKRIRCYNPSSARALHVFPDAHPRARKSQVDFDHPNLERFPNFAELPSPDLDVVLRPGHALFIPAFWFHHVENGLVGGKNESSTEESDLGCEDGPSVSLNLFAVSDAMMMAQNIFQDSNQPFGRSAVASTEFAVTALHALSWKLLSGLNLGHSPKRFTQEELLDARYAPLRDQQTETKIDERLSTNYQKINLSPTDEESVTNCVDRILPQFENLRENFGEGVMTITLCHLFELWAVQMVGASKVADVWEEVVLLNED
mmetsp:Transcript_16653/g.40467  ORF Transcript_16653/g.40467 Transcript_16653/m.40467 type:complete len:462 (+) Transcript_16653:216-1601(+)